jgi:phage terminase large subunit-like protein
MTKPFLYKFYIDDKVYENVPYAAYKDNKKINVPVMDMERNRLFLGLTVHSYSSEYLAGNKEARDRYEWLRQDQKLNRLKYYAPNSISQLEFLNDWDEHDVIALVAPNRVGKTTAGVVKALISGILPLDPEWPIFKDHGVAFVPFKGKERELRFAMGSYEWSHIKSVVWPRVREYVPDEMLGAYSRNFQKTRGRPRKDPNFDRMPQLELSCGTVLKFHAYSQSQANFESDAYNGFLYDEQPPEVIFNAVDERTRTLKGKHFFTLTPHKVEGRPDTGGGGWLQKFLTGEEKKGHSISCYNTSLADVPDWIYPESEKHKAFQKWIHEPTALRNIKTLREGRSRVLGEWHKTSGLVIDEWDKRIHVVDDFTIPENWTLYRGLDHGVTNPTACVWAAVSPPKGDWGSTVAIYREYYSTGKLVNENVSEVIRLSGNTRKSMGSVNNPRAGTVMPIWEEVQTGEFYAKTVLDGRSFANNDPGSGKTFGQLYRANGLPCFAASGKNHTHWVPILKELFAPDYDADHHWNKDKKGVPEKGMSHIVIFRSCVNLIREIEGWVWEEYRSGGDSKNLKESPRKLNDHGCTALAYLCQIPMRYRGDMYRPSSRDDGYRDGGESDSDYSGEDDYRGV